MSPFQETWTVTNNVLSGQSHTNYPYQFEAFGRIFSLEGFQSKDYGLPSLGVIYDKSLNGISIQIDTIVDQLGQDLVSCITKPLNP